jgi:hypothetical protein
MINRESAIDLAAIGGGHSPYIWRCLWDTVAFSSGGAKLEPTLQGGSNYVRLLVGWHSEPAGSGGRTTGSPAVFHRRLGLGVTNYTPGMVVVCERVRCLRAPRRTITITRYTSRPAAAVWCACERGSDICPTEHHSVPVLRCSPFQKRPGSSPTETSVRPADGRAVSLGG